MTTNQDLPGQPAPARQELSENPGGEDGDDQVLSASGVLFVDTVGRVLLVRVRYDAAWPFSVPGGGREDGEDPRRTAVREIEEELGISPVLGELACVDWALSRGERPPVLAHLYWAAPLSAHQLAAITLQPEEIESWDFHTAEDAEAVLAPRLGRRVAACLTAGGRGPIELVSSGPPDGADRAPAPLRAAGQGGAADVTGRVHRQQAPGTGPRRGPGYRLRRPGPADRRRRRQAICSPGRPGAGPQGDSASGRPAAHRPGARGASREGTAADGEWGTGADTPQSVQVLDGGHLREPLAANPGWWCPLRRLDEVMPEPGAARICSALAARARGRRLVELLDGRPVHVDGQQPSGECS